MSGSSGTTGLPIPKAITPCGAASPGGLLEPMNLDSSGNLRVTGSFAPPALQNVNITEIDSNPISIGPGVSNSGTQQVILSSDSPLAPNAATASNQAAQETTLTAIQSNQTNGTQETNIVGTVPLPTGAATSANQVTQETTLSAIQANQTNGAQVTSVSNFPATQPVSGTVTANQGSANTSANGWPVKITDGTNVGGISPASTAAVATQPAQVVGLSPNSPLPAGSNALGSVSVSNFPSTSPPAAFYSGQQTSTGTAVAISASQAIVNGAIIQALAANAGNVYVGPSGVTTSTGFQLQPGQATSVAVANLSTIYVIAAAGGDGICYVGS